MIQSIDINSIIYKLTFSKLILKGNLNKEIALKFYRMI